MQPDSERRFSVVGPLMPPKGRVYYGGIVPPGDDPVTTIDRAVALLPGRIPGEDPALSSFVDASTGLVFVVWRILRVKPIH
jgi:hypothetical protein